MDCFVMKGRVGVLSVGEIFFSSITQKGGEKQAADSLNRVRRSYFISKLGLVNIFFAMP